MNNLKKFANKYNHFLILIIVTFLAFISINTYQDYKKKKLIALKNYLVIHIF